MQGLRHTDWEDHDQGAPPRRPPPSLRRCRAGRVAFARTEGLTRAVPPQQAYYHGVVLARCPGCDNLHLIADRLGWFEDESTDIMDIVRKRGEEAKFVRSEEDLLELALEDVAGADKVEEAVRGAMQGSSQAAAEEAGNGGTPAGGRGGGESAQ